MKGHLSYVHCDISQWLDALPPLTRMSEGVGVHRSQDRRQQQIPALMGAYVCVCVPAVIITRIRVEPNPCRVPSSSPPLAPTALSGLQQQLSHPQSEHSHGKHRRRPDSRWRGTKDTKHSSFSFKFIHISSLPLSYWSPVAWMKYWASAGKMYSTSFNHEGAVKWKLIQPSICLEEGCNMLETTGRRMGEKIQGYNLITMCSVSALVNVRDYYWV